MSAPSKTTILRLYKHLIKYGRQLKLTDQEYFIHRVKQDFKENKSLQNPEEILFNFKRGETLLKNGRVV